MQMQGVPGTITRATRESREVAINLPQEKRASERASKAENDAKRQTEKEKNRGCYVTFSVLPKVVRSLRKH